MSQSEHANPSAQLSNFVAALSYNDLPQSVIDKVKQLFIDWLGSAIAGNAHQVVSSLEIFAEKMGSAEGQCTTVSTLNRTSSYFAAMINAASSHVVEQDDLHNSSVFHPATVIFPAVVAIAEERGIDGKTAIEGMVAGYEVGIRVGEFLGRSHYEHFHTTGTAGTLGAAVAVAKIIGLDAKGILHAMGSAGTMTAGLWEFLRDGADSKQLHTAHAAANGLLAAVMAESNVKGASEILTGAHGMGVAMSNDANPVCLTDGLNQRWALLETSFKWHSSCRHTHPAADALGDLLTAHNLLAKEIQSITAYVHQAAIDVLGAVSHPATIHQSKFCMGSVLGLIAVFGKAGLEEFDQSALSNPEVLRFLDCVEMVFDPEIDRAYPKKWTSKVVVETVDGLRYEHYVETPKGDPENPLTLDEIIDKALRLSKYGNVVPSNITRSWIDNILRLEKIDNFQTVLKH